MANPTFNLQALLKELEVIYEDNHLIAVNKRGGHLVQGDATGDFTLAELVKAYIKLRYKKTGDVYLGIIHRLDRPVSGVVVFARTSKALTRMNDLMRKREIKKTYLAVVRERPNPMNGTLKHFLVKDNARNVSKVVPGKSRRNPDAKLSELSYELLGSLDGMHLLNVLLKTGRPHQIRVQLAEIGCPIKGDLKYGFRSANGDGSIHLHCREMHFIHPVKKEPISIQADTPKKHDWNKFQGLIL